MFLWPMLRCCLLGALRIFDSMHLLVDPTSFEEPLLDTTFTIVHDDTGELLSVTQHGLASEKILDQCVDTAKARTRALCDQIYL
jgi:exosome complex component RRP43